MTAPKRTYTMSKAAHAVRKAASAKAAEVRPSGKKWHTITVDADTHERILAQQIDGESLGAVVARKFT